MLYSAKKFHGGMDTHTFKKFLVCHSCIAFHTLNSANPLTRRQGNQPMGVLSFLYNDGMHPMGQGCCASQ